MPFVLIGIYLGSMAAIAALNAGSGLLLAFGLFSLFGALSLVGGLVIATVCVVRASYVGDTSG